MLSKDNFASVTRTIGRSGFEAPYKQERVADSTSLFRSRTFVSVHFFLSFLVLLLIMVSVNGTANGHVAINGNGNSSSNGHDTMPSDAKQITVSEYIVERIKQVGVKQVFGVPGDYNLEVSPFQRHGRSKR